VVAVRLNLNFNDIRFFIAGKRKIRKAAPGTGLARQPMVFFDDGKIGAGRTSVTRASFLLSSWTFDGRCR
jgi:hypothetical protein